MLFNLSDLIQIIIILIPFITLVDFYFEQMVSELETYRIFFSFKAEYSLKLEFQVFLFI